MNGEGCLPGLDRAVWRCAAPFKVLSKLGAKYDVLCQ